MRSSLCVFPRRVSPRGWLGLVLGCFASVACAEGSGGVTRMAGGVRYEGRFISPEAYAAYAEGVEHETRGEYDKAVAWYQEARANDPSSPEIWARIGSARCFGAGAQRGPSAAARAFENGIRLDSNYYGNYFERARCAEHARLFAQGLADARAAVARRPGDEGANLLVARLLQAQGQRADARAWLEAFQGYRGASPTIKRALDAARRLDSPALPALPALPAAPAPSVPPTPSPAASPTRSASPARSVAFSELRAGKFEAARQHAKTELGADPTNADAWIATLIACDALGDVQCFDGALDSLKLPSLAPSETGLAFLSELLLRRAGASFAR